MPSWTAVDLRMTAQQDQLREDLRRWLVANLPWEYGVGLPPRSADLDAEVSFGRSWQSRLAADRWVGITWPVELGGRGLGPTEHFVVTEELARARAPELVGRIGINLVAPTLFAHGTDEQRRRWLPPILDADQLWCQLFSEPDAGSDLASLSTRADQVDGGYRVTGRKVWTSYAQFADWGLCLARSHPDAPKRQLGMTCLVVDMHASGVDVRPLVQITGEAEFNEVFLDEVFVPDDQVVGDPGQGWSVANSTLSHERGVNPRQLGIHCQLLLGLLELARDSEHGFADRDMRQRLAEAYIEVKLFQLNNWRTLTRLEHGEPPGPEGSALKLYWSEMSKRLHQTVLGVLGPSAGLWQGATRNPGDGMWQRSWLYYQASSIFSGTNEIQRTLVGERVLGLPRG
ncbi:MAG TPA: acyl-CoA dehydrogenase family protein [Acidimicrobiales bacterium]|jgi:alkylation response protein AidB-like acyl-CoA dehydrogenase|nr:acyl-CoA dehydrogenase family protein [Acidimicrobiales bacterium]